MIQTPPWIAITTLNLALGASCVGPSPEPGPRSPTPMVRQRPHLRRTAPALPPPTRVTVKGWKVEVSLEPEKRTFMLGEPIYLTYKVQNLSGVDLLIPEGGAYRNRLGRPERYRVVVEARGGKGRGVKPLPVVSGPGFGGSMSNRKLPDGGTFTRELFLPNWARITRPGVYEIRCSRDLTLLPASTRRFSFKRSGPRVTARTLVTVTPPDDRRLKKLIDELGGLLRSSYEPPARKAAQALAAIHDARTVAHWIRAYRFGGYSRQLRAIIALGKYKTDAALAGLRLCQSNRNKALRLTCAQALSGSPHPRAWPTLLKMKSDPDLDVRNTVLGAAMRRSCRKHIALIRSYTKDPSKLVSGEAKRILKECKP